MKKGSTIFLRAAIWAIGLAVLAICVFLLPAGLGSDNTDHYWPILAGLYVPAVPFFFALFQTLKLLQYIDTDHAFSELSTKALAKIKHCAAIITLIFTAGSPYIYHVANIDDAPGVMLLGCIIIGASASIAVFAAVLQRLLQSAIDIKNENDLTV